MTSEKDRLEKRVKELFGQDAKVDIEYMIRIPITNKSYSREFNLLEEFSELLMDFYYIPQEKL